MNPRWYSPITEEILGTRRTKNHLPQTGNEVVKEVFPEEAAFTEPTGVNRL